jgi:hypothetical protein
MKYHGKRIKAWLLYLRTLDEGTAISSQSLVNCSYPSVTKLHSPCSHRKPAITYVLEYVRATLFTSYSSTGVYVRRDMDFVQSMESWAEEAIEPLLMSSSDAWQPSDLLPDPASPDFIDAIRMLRSECQTLPAEYLVVLVGDMVTEEALPSYMSMLNRMDGTKDATGARCVTCCSGLFAGAESQQ